MIQFRLGSALLFLDHLSHRDIGAERQAWNADADHEHQDRKERIVKAGSSERSVARKRSPNRKAGKDERGGRRVARTAAQGRPQQRQYGKEAQSALLLWIFE